MYSATTRAIEVQVEPVYLDEQSEPDDGRFVWAYHVRIENQGPESVQLLNRYWRIVDARGQVQEVRGAGVVGEQPTLDPGESYEYTSGCPLQTSSGFMQGSYEMVNRSGEHFDIEIPAFSLDSPFVEGPVH